MIGILILMAISKTKKAISYLKWMGHRAKRQVEQKGLREEVTPTTQN